MNHWILWQLADSAFPSGGFAHSAGLEAAVQLGEVSGGSGLDPQGSQRGCGFATSIGLEEFVSRSLWQAGALALPLVAAAHADPDALADVDRICDAMTRSHVANRASRAQGQAFLRASAAAFPAGASPLAARAQSERLPGHLAPVVGAVLHAIGAGRDEAQRLLLFLASRGLVSAGVRLGLVGPLEGQAIQARAAAVAERVLAACGGMTLDEAAQIDPLLELLQAHQDRLYSRLFQS